MSVTRTSVQDNVVDHIALVFGVVEAERAAQVFREVLRCIVVVSSLHMHGEGIPETDAHTERRIIGLPKSFFPIKRFYMCEYSWKYTTSHSFSFVSLPRSESFLTCSRWKKNSLCTWRASCHRGGPCSAGEGSACIQSWTRRTRKWGRRLVDCQPLSSHHVLSRKTFDCGRPAGNDWAADEHPLAPGMKDLGGGQRNFKKREWFISL